MKREVATILCLGVLSHAASASTLQKNKRVNLNPPVAPASAVTVPLFPGTDPGGAMATVKKKRSGSTIIVENAALRMGWRTSSGLEPTGFFDKLSGKNYPVPREAFVIVRRDGTELKASDMKVIGDVQVEKLTANPQASRGAERVPGKAVTVRLETPEGGLRIDWRAMLRDDSNYIRQQVVIQAVRENVDIARIVLVDGKLPNAEVSGTVAGSPVVAGTVFTGLEHPMAHVRIKQGLFGAERLVPMPEDKGAAECEDDPLPKNPEAIKKGLGGCLVQVWLDRALPLSKGKSFTCSSVTGVVPKGQVRRGFLYYLERERAHPYRPFLHYNSWYDIGYFTKYNEKDCLGAINAFVAELGEKRGVKMASFLFDDGWDDPTKGGQWCFNSGFPHGFTPLREAAAKIGAAPGVWLSPWGGYGDPRIQRVKSGEAAGYEASGKPGYSRLFALSGPKYYAQFHRACTDMVSKYGINQFKLDGTGNINTVVPGSRFGSDFEAAIALIGDLRKINPDLFINLTTGTWPSPFWLSICDSIWRGGSDHQFAGIGSARQRWITYRDADTYERVVRGGPLFPVSSLMLHGIIYAKHAKKLNTDPEGDFMSEVRSYFGTGTQLQEMYISHDLLSDNNWDTLAECAKWSRANAATLVDTHWIGGSPRSLQVYGWASWSPKKGIVTLRNPDEKPKTFALRLDACFELPEDAAKNYRIHSPYKQQRRHKELDGTIAAGKPVALELRPFEVMVIEAWPSDDQTDPQ